MKKKERVFLVDASSILFRAYFAIPFMAASKNFKKALPTGAVYGFITTTLKILNHFNPRHIVYCFDRPEPSHRVRYFKDYKANREEMPEDLQVQIPYIKKSLDLLGIKRMDKKGYEADDLIGSLCHFSKKPNIETTIISSDKDFAQLVSPGIKFFDPVKEFFYGPDEIKNKWGVLPSQMVDYLAIVGDASDNIPGVRGIGPKGASKLLAQYKNLESIYKNLNKTKTLEEKLKKSKKEAFLSKKLAQIVTNLKLVKNLSDMEKKNMKEKEMSSFLEELEFFSIQKKLFPKNLKEQGKTKLAPAGGRSKKIMKVSLKDFSETLPPYSEVTVFLTKDFVQALYKNHLLEWPKKSAKSLGAALSRKKARWKGWDLKTIWHECGAENPIPAFDLITAEHLVEGRPASSLQNLAKKEEVSIFDLEALFREYKDKLEEKNCKSVYEELERPLTPVLYRMERRGVMLDTKKLKLERENLECGLIDLESKIFSLAGHPFNLASPSQLACVLFDEMGLKKGRKTKTGYSTDNDVLQALKKEHPIASLICDYRELFKLKTTYVEGLSREMNKKTKKVHTRFNQTLTATGRLSSVSPNLQNIPIRTERGRRIRAAFICPKNSILIGADYSQIELRVLAHLSDDPHLKKAFLENEDIHQSAASEIFNQTLNKVTSEQRQIAKAVNFGIIYGQGAFSLAESLNISRSEAQDMIDRWYHRFNKVKAYMNAALKQAQKKGEIQTLFGRKRKIPELFSKNIPTRKWGERAAFNAIIQGTASDIVKKAMIKLDQALLAPLLLQVHDELIFECLKEDEEDQIHDIKKIMQSAVKLKVPLRVSVASGSNWDQAK